MRPSILSYLCYMDTGQQKLSLKMCYSIVHTHIEIRQLDNETKIYVSHFIQILSMDSLVSLIGR